MDMQLSQRKLGPRIFGIGGELLLSQFSCHHSFTSHKAFACSSVFMSTKDREVIGRVFICSNTFDKKQLLLTILSLLPALEVCVVDK